MPNDLGSSDVMVDVSTHFKFYSTYNLIDLAWYCAKQLYRVYSSLRYTLFIQSIASA